RSACVGCVKVPLLLRGRNNVLEVTGRSSMLSMAAASELRPSDHAVRWYAIYTRHQHEKNVAGILASKGFETLLPLYSAAHRWKDPTKLLSLPLFPCYVFIKGGLERRLDILTTPGIHALVSTAGQPAAIPHS